MGTIRRYCGSFPRSPSGARRARGLIKNFAKAYLSGCDLEDFETAIGEALANAVEHSDASTLTVRCWCESGCLVTELEDDGRGFFPPLSFQAPPDGALRGFGLFIMHQLLDEIDFLDNGKRLHLVKRLPANKKATARR